MYPRVPIGYISMYPSRRGHGIKCSLQKVHFIPFIPKLQRGCRSLLKQQQKRGSLNFRSKFNNFLDFLQPFATVESISILKTFDFESEKPNINVMDIEHLGPRAHVR